MGVCHLELKPCNCFHMEILQELRAKPWSQSQSVSSGQEYKAPMCGGIYCNADCTVLVSSGLGQVWKLFFLQPGSASKKWHTSPRSLHYTTVADLPGHIIRDSCQKSFLGVTWNHIESLVTHTELCSDDMRVDSFCQCFSCLRFAWQSI